MVSKKIYFWLIDLYVSKYITFQKKDFCGIISISETNSKSYNKVMGLLKDNGIITGNTIMTLNKKLLGKYIRSLDVFNKTGKFIEKDKPFDYNY